MNKDKDKDDDSSDDGGHDPEDGYSSTDELLEKHKKLIRGLQSAQSMKQTGGKPAAGMNLDLAHHPRVGLTSAKVPPKTMGKGGVPMSSTSDFTLPPILKPLLDEHIGKKKAKREDSVTK